MTGFSTSAPASTSTASLARRDLFSLRTDQPSAPIIVRCCLTRTRHTSFVSAFRRVGNPYRQFTCRPSPQLFGAHHLRSVFSFDGAAKCSRLGSRPLPRHEFVPNPGSFVPARGQGGIY